MPVISIFCLLIVIIFFHHFFEKDFLNWRSYEPSVQQAEWATRCTWGGNIEWFICWAIHEGMKGKYRSLVSRASFLSPGTEIAKDNILF